MKTGTPVHITSTRQHGTITNTLRERNTVRLTNGDIRYYDDNELQARYTVQSLNYAKKAAPKTVITDNNYPDGTYVSK
jgi:hypothetical protein